MQCFFVYFSPILDFFQSDTATLSITTSEKFYSQHIRLKQGSTLHRHQKEHPTYYKTKKQPNRHGQTALITIYIFMIPSCLLSLFFQNASYLWVTCVTTQSSQPFRYHSVNLTKRSMHEFLLLATRNTWQCKQSTVSILLL